MNKRNAGFTLVEMLIVIAIFGFVLAGTSDMFISILRTHRQQSRITETNIEGIIGLELLRQDIEKAGFGLPWNMAGFTYNEANGNPHGLNDSTTNAAPRGIVSANNAGWQNTDYLVIKAANIATNTASGKWAFLPESPGTITPWSLQSENLQGTDKVIVISPGTPASATARTLMTWNTLFNAVSGFAAPVSSPETRIIYGIDTGPIRMPFNRADYFVTQPASSDMPRRCAPGTGILYKAVVNQDPATGGGFSYMPLLDCVADMQVIFRYTDDTGNLTTINIYDDITLLGNDAAAIRNQVKEARVFILAHEGQKDTNYQHPVSSPHVGDPGFGRNFNLATAITDWQNYRWKIYTLVVRLDNLN